MFPPTYVYLIINLDNNQIDCAYLDLALAEQYLKDYFTNPDGSCHGKISRVMIRRD